MGGGLDDYLIDQLLRGVETVQKKVEEKEAQARAKAEKEALEVAATQQNSAQDASLSTEEPPASDEDADVEMRPLNDKDQYKKVGNEWWVRIYLGRRIPRLNAEMVIEDKDMKAKKRWRDTANEGYTRVLVHDPTVGRIYHHMAVLVQPRSVWPLSMFEVNASKLFYCTKSLVVKTPFYPTRNSVLTVVQPILHRYKKAAQKPIVLPLIDEDHFLAVVVHLILSSLEPETLRENGY
ncbi:hypothetical protein AYO20_08880 [Fonsecaea nubica]|uniref:Uncharacterized protein n=1 Tax=Fonsecaea nubica TaxID=856822 RepID=A0A178CLC6_9EURO|nr:hypothetical protein AYO20_08880 [Fonsecaea nubica]OAL30164.1 hypothetical protein AYO20_08880 [Fonsecaea nubica]